MLLFLREVITRCLRVEKNGDIVPSLSQVFVLYFFRNHKNFIKKGIESTYTGNKLTNNLSSRNQAKQKESITTRIANLNQRRGNKIDEDGQDDGLNPIHTSRQENILINIAFLCLKFLFLEFPKDKICIPYLDESFISWDGWMPTVYLTSSKVELMYGRISSHWKANASSLVFGTCFCGRSCRG